MRLPTWDEVEKRDYEPWQSSRLVVDTAYQSADESFAELMKKLNQIMELEI